MSPYAMQQQQANPYNQQNNYQNSSSPGFNMPEYGDSFQGFSPSMEMPAYDQNIRDMRSSSMATDLRQEYQQIQSGQTNLNPFSFK